MLQGLGAESLELTEMAPVANASVALGLLEDRRLTLRLLHDSVMMDHFGVIQEMLAKAPGLLGLAAAHLQAVENDQEPLTSVPELVQNSFSSQEPEAQDLLNRLAMGATPMDGRRLLTHGDEPSILLKHLVEQGWITTMSERSDDSEEHVHAPMVMLQEPLAGEMLSLLAKQAPADEHASQVEEMHLEWAVRLIQEASEAQSAELPSGMTPMDRFQQARYHFLQVRDLDGALEASQPYSGFLMAGGFLHDLRRSNQQLLDQGLEHAAVMNWIALSHLHAGEPQPAEHWFHRAADKCGDVHSQEAAMAWHGLASVDMAQHKTSSALKRLGRVAEIQERLEEPEACANTLHQMATLYMEQNHLKDARETLERARQLDRKAGNKRGESATLHQLGALDMREGKVVPALAVFQEAEEMDRALNNTLGLSNVLPWIANILFTRGELNEAKSYFEEALELRRVFPDKASEAFILHQLGTVSVHQGDHDGALQRYRASLKLKQELRDFKGQATTFFQLARMAKEKNALEDALRLVGISHRIDQEFENLDAKQEWEIILEIADALEIDEPTLDHILEEAWDLFRHDQGWGLLERTFKKRTVIPIKQI